MKKIYLNVLSRLCLKFIKVAIFYLMKLWVAILILVILIAPSYGINNSPVNSLAKSNFIGHFEKSVYIKPGHDFYIHFSPQKGIDFKEENFNLSYKERVALSKVPSWIRQRLALQFEKVEDEYADLIINSSKRYVDEIAFIIATSPPNEIPSPSLIYDDVRFLYKNDEYIDYADILDMENGSSTLRYTTLEDGRMLNVTCPMNIYYWYVVHPRITFEDAEMVYDKFWREYLFYHNDIGYPLLMEKLHGIKYLWDGKSYRPPAHRTWKWSMENHPTAIEALNYWVGKTINQYAIGDRPGQPNVIAHEHNGFCGEIQQLSVAAQRAALIPTVGINDLGEDHVWREFWERGWHQCDNWWADGGGSVANYGEYRYGWGKIISALFAWNGDSSIYDVTPKYIKSDDRATLEVEVRDLFGKPVDGARVMGFGSWKANNFKDKLWSKYVDKIWQLLPAEIREKWEKKYDEMKKFYRERVPGLIPWILPSIWNYTDTDGRCSFQLGLGHSYLIVVQKDDIFYYGPYSVGKSNALHYFIALPANSTKNMKVRFIMPDRRNMLKENVISSHGEKYGFNLNFRCTGYQEERNPWDWKYALEKTKAKINLFVVDKENFEKYAKGMEFDCFNYLYSEKGNIEFNADDEIYIVFNNTASRTGILLNFDMDVNGKGDFIHVTSPENNSIINVGLNKIEGYATGDGSISIDGATWKVKGEFSIFWNATPGAHIIVAKCGNFIKNYLVEVVDCSPPEITISSPTEGEIFNNSVVIKGNVYDNSGVNNVSVEINGEFFWLNTHFNLSYSLPPSDYEMKITALDMYGLKSTAKINFTVKGEKVTPIINRIYYLPENPTNESNVVVYADVEPSFYHIKKVSINIDGNEMEMYRYADNPPQSRHEEDALKNMSNEPVYGIELGQMEKGKHSFFITAMDSAGNEEKSEEYVIHIS